MTKPKPRVQAVPIALSFLSAAILCLSVSAGSAFAQSCSVCGDVTGNGKVNIADAMFIAQRVAGLRASVPCPGFGDFNQSGASDNADATMIAQSTVGLQGTLSCLSLGITSPIPLDVLNTASITVMGIVGGATGVSCNGQPATISGSTFSVPLTLVEGTNVISCVAQDAGAGAVTANISITLDSTPPRVTIDTPGDGLTVMEATTSVTGMINDVVVGTVNAADCHVVCNGIEAAISNRSFVASNVPLQPGTAGANTISCIGTDRAGNTGTGSVTLTLDLTPKAHVLLVSGGNQTGMISNALPSPLVAKVVDDLGNPIAGQPVIFKVTQNDGVLTAGNQSARSLIVNSDASGLAQVQFALGSRAGAGNNQIMAEAVGFEGQALFVESSIVATPSKIVVDMGNNQLGAVNTPLPRPFVIVLFDSGNNRLGGAPVTFTVVEGSGNIGGQQSVTVNTDSDGRAQAFLTLGPNEGRDNNTVEVNFAGNIAQPSTFVGSGMVKGDPLATRVVGVVLDNTGLPVPGVTLSLNGTNLSTQSDEEGQFVLAPAPVGAVHLFVNGATAQRPGVWPNLGYSIVTVPGHDNTIPAGRPIYLLPIDLASGLFVDPAHGGTLTFADLPGFSLDVAPGSVTFPDGSKSGTVSVTLVHSDTIPMIPNFGQQPRFIITIQPAGAIFNPPAPICVPNTDALPPGQKTETSSFDHDLGQFIGIGPSTVTEDGTSICSDPGVGILKAGWHSSGNPSPFGECEHDCDDGNDCTSDSRGAGGACQHSNEADGTKCRDSMTKMTMNGVNYEVDASCMGDCKAGACGKDSNGFSTAAALNGLKAAGDKAFDPCVMGTLATDMQNCLKMGGFKAMCAAGPDCASAAPGTHTLNIQPAAYDVASCQDFNSSVLHEIVHACGNFRHDKCKADGTPLGAISCGGVADCVECVDSATDKSYGCEASCYPGVGSTVGMASACK